MLTTCLYVCSNYFLKKKTLRINTTLQLVNLQLLHLPCFPVSIITFLVFSISWSSHMAFMMLSCVHHHCSCALYQLKFTYGLHDAYYTTWCSGLRYAFCIHHPVFVLSTSRRSHKAFNEPLATFLVLSNSRHMAITGLTSPLFLPLSQSTDQPTYYLALRHDLDSAE